MCGDGRERGTMGREYILMFERGVLVYSVHIVV
jgi:hypothetical protein